MPNGLCGVEWPYLAELVYARRYLFTQYAHLCDVSDAPAVARKCTHPRGDARTPVYRHAAPPPSRHTSHGASFPAPLALLIAHLFHAVRKILLTSDLIEGFELIDQNWRKITKVLSAAAFSESAMPGKCLAGVAKATTEPRRHGGRGQSHAAGSLLRLLGDFAERHQSGRPLHWS